MGAHVGDIADAHWHDARIIWNYHQMGHELRPCSAAIGLGCDELGVAAHTARLYHEGLFPVVVFTGATSRRTAVRFPRGEATHYREHAIELGIPERAILVEPTATNTGQNIERSHAVLRHAGVPVDSVLLVSKPYMQRRAYATCRKTWPEVNAICASESLDLNDYAEAAGNGRHVIDMLVGDLQRIIEYPERGFAIAQEVPASTRAAYGRLVRAGFTSGLLVA